MEKVHIKKFLIQSQQENFKLGDKITTNLYNIEDRVTIYGYTEKRNNITALEFRKTDGVWCYQVGHGSWWAETSLKLIKGDKS
jgi:hypothetical protein